MGTAVVTVLSLSHKNSKTYKDKINCLIHKVREEQHISQNRSPKGLYLG